MLRELAISLKSMPSSQSQVTPSATTSDSLRDTLQHHGSDEDNDVEADPTFAAQAVFASEFLQEAVTRTPLQQESRLESAVKSLHQIVAMQNRSSSQESRLEHVKPLPPGGFRELPMLPVELVVSFLRQIKSK